jgi:hypothetical protein
VFPHHRRSGVTRPRRHTDPLGSEITTALFRRTVGLPKGAGRGARHNPAGTMVGAIAPLLHPERCPKNGRLAGETARRHRQARSLGAETTALPFLSYAGCDSRRGRQGRTLTKGTMIGAIEPLQCPALCPQKMVISRGNDAKAPSDALLWAQRPRALPFGCSRPGNSSGSCLARAYEVAEIEIPPRAFCLSVTVT